MWCIGTFWYCYIYYCVYMSLTDQTTPTILVSANISTLVYARFWMGNLPHVQPQHSIFLLCWAPFYDHKQVIEVKLVSGDKWIRHYHWTFMVNLSPTLSELNTTVKAAWNCVVTFLYNRLSISHQMCFASCAAEFSSCISEYASHTFYHSHLHSWLNLHSC